MKKIFIIFSFLASTIIFSSPSYAEWSRVGKSNSGSTTYVDLERIRKHNGFIYFWRLTDYLKPNKGGYVL